MKTLSISVLVLIACPFSILSGQESKSARSTYFADRKPKINSSANHIRGGTAGSKRATGRPRIPTSAETANWTNQNSASQVGSSFTSNFGDQIKPTAYNQNTSMVNFSKLATAPLSATAVAKRITKPTGNETLIAATPLSEFSKTPIMVSAATPATSAATPVTSSVSGGDFFAKVKDTPTLIAPTKAAPTRIASMPFSPFKTLEMAPSGVSPLRRPAKQVREVIEEGIEVVVPPTAESITDEIVRPTPQNSQSEFLPPTIDSNSGSTSKVVPDVTDANIQTNEPEHEYRETFAAEPERVSLEELRVPQRIDSWTEHPPSSMRHVTDHFSPGGQPFARRTHHFENPNYFGVDRHTCCDEWASECNCSGGLKVNPGHLGIPWLGSKENCDSTEPVCKHCRSGRCGRRGCQSCSN